MLSRILFATVVLFCLTQANASANDGQYFRSFLASLTSYYESYEDDSEEAIRNIKELLIQRPRVFRWLADDADFNRVLTESGINDLLGRQGVGIQKLQDEYVSTLGSSIDFVRGDLGQSNLDVGGKSVFKVFSQVYSDLSEPRRRSIVEKIPNSIFHVLVLKTNQFIEEVDVSNILKLDGFFDTNYYPSSNNNRANDAINQLVAEYVNTFSLSQRKKIIARAFQFRDESLTFAFCISIIEEMGIYMQKLFQLLSRKVDSPLMNKILDRVSSDLQKQSIDELVAQFSRNTGLNFTDHFELKQPVKIFRATTAHAVLATYKPTNQEVFIKLRLPNIESDVESEVTRVFSLPSLSKNIGLKTFLSSFVELVRREINYNIEASLTILMQDRFNFSSNGISVRSVRLFDQLKFESSGQPYSKNTLIYELVEGKKISDLDLTKDYVVIHKMLDMLTFYWFNHAFFDSIQEAPDLQLLSVATDNNFAASKEFPTVFHADIHPGNFMMDVYESTTTLLDWGNFGVFTLKERRLFVDFFISCYTGDVSKVSQILFDITNTDDLALQAQISMIVQQALSMHSDASARAKSIVTRTVDEVGIVIPKGITAFIKAADFIGSHYIQLSAAYNELGDEFKSENRLAVPSMRTPLTSAVLSNWRDYVGVWFSNSLNDQALLNRHLQIKLLKQLAKYKISKIRSRCSLLLSGAH